MEAVELTTVGSPSWYLVELFVRLEMPEWMTRLILAVVWLALRLQFWPLAKLARYRPFEPNPESVLVTCCTNGLGHVHQMERVLTVLEAEGIAFPVIALAKEKKVPSYKLDALKARFPSARIVNLDFEVDYDNGKSFKNSAIAWSALKQSCSRSVQLSRKVVGLLRRYRPAYCLSFWEPSVASIIDVVNAPTRVLSIASQGQIYRDESGAAHEGRGVMMRALRLLNLG